MPFAVPLGERDMKPFFCSLMVVAALCLSLPVRAAGPETARFISGSRQVSYEIFGAKSTGPIVIMLHGAGGPNLPLYRNLAQTFAASNYTVLFLHYFDATDTVRASPGNYAIWQKAVGDLLGECKNHPDWSGRKIALLGFSLGASVALAAGSQMLPVSAVGEWYGSLPDEFFYQLKGMPPLLILHGAQDGNIPVLNAKQLIRLCEMKHFTCESHVYSDQGHGFLPPAYENAVKRTLDFFSRRLR